MLDPTAPPTETAWSSTLEYDINEPDPLYNGMLARCMLYSMSDRERWSLAKKLQAEGKLSVPFEIGDSLGQIAPPRMGFQQHASSATPAPAPVASQSSFHSGMLQPGVVPSSFHGPMAGTTAYASSSSAAAATHEIQHMQQQQEMMHMTASMGLLEQNGQVLPMGALQAAPGLEQTGTFQAAPGLAPNLPRTPQPQHGWQSVASAPPGLHEVLYNEAVNTRPTLRLDESLMDTTAQPEAPRQTTAMRKEAKREAAIDAHNNREDTSDYTTVVLQNLPAIDKATLLSQLLQAGFQAGTTFDFLYYPSNFDSRSASAGKRHHGYAIINFNTHELAVEFMCATKSKMQKGDKELPISAKWALVQSFEENAARYIKRHDRIRDPSFRPTMWIQGNPEALTLTKDNLPPDMLERLTKQVADEKSAGRAKEEREKAERDARKEAKETAKLQFDPAQEKKTDEAKEEPISDEAPAQPSGYNLTTFQ